MNDEGPRYSVGSKLEIPPGYIKAADAATAQGMNPEVLRRRLRNEPAFVSAVGARKLPWRGRGLWIVPEKVSLPARQEGQPSATTGRHLSETERETVARRAHAGAPRTTLASQFGISRPYVYKLMKLYPKAKNT